MRNLGSIADFEEQRNADLYNAFRQQMRRALSLQGFIALPEVYARTAASPAARFWVTPERATIIIAAMFKGKSIAYMRPLRQAMYNEIFVRVKELKKQFPPDTPLNKLVFKVILQPAPSFYLSPKSAKVIICKIKSGWYAQRRTSQPQKHLTTI